MERFCRRPFRPMAEYATARVLDRTEITAELHATVRQNGRALDAFQFRVGGDIFNVEVQLDNLIPLPLFKGWMVRFQQDPHTIKLRPNLATSVWQDFPALIMMREAEVFDSTGAGIGPGEFIRMLDALEEDPVTAAFRWALVINDALGVSLQMQSLPATSTSLCGKPTMRK
jgi:hypothetical protein